MFFFSWHFKNAIWWLKLRQTAAAVWWLGDSSSPSPEPSDTQRSKLAPRVKPAQSIKCNRWFWRWIDSTTSDPFEELFRMHVWDHGWATVSHGDGLTTPARWLMVLWPGVPSWASRAEFKTGFGSSSPPPTHLPDSKHVQQQRYQHHHVLTMNVWTVGDIWSPAMIKNVEKKTHIEGIQHELAQTVNASAK